MGIRRDWFKNKVDILAQAAAVVLGLKKSGQVQEAAAKLEEAFRSAFGMDPRMTLALPLKDCLDMLGRGVKPSPELTAALASFFADWAEALEASGRQDEAALARQKAAECGALK
ncbi:hypothetical protein EPO15_13940 [bacterium]|nr:MAG: hypothetical protein EPO15_13940 [bacterium]